MVWWPALTPMGTHRHEVLSQRAGEVVSAQMNSHPSCALISPDAARGAAVMGQEPEALLVPVVPTWAGFLWSFHLAFPYPQALSSV